MAPKRQDLNWGHRPPDLMVDTQLVSNITLSHRQLGTLDPSKPPSFQCFWTLVSNFCGVKHWCSSLMGGQDYCRDQTLTAAGLGVTGLVQCSEVAGSLVTCDCTIRSGDCDTTYHHRWCGSRCYGVWYLGHKWRRPWWPVTEGLIVARWMSLWPVTHR